MRSFQFLILSILLWSTQAFAANPLVEMKTSAGSMRIVLFADKAPKTVANFLRYVKDGYYDGLVFHRIIDGFMIQGGGYYPDLNEKKGARPPIENEAGNRLKNEVGTLAMARRPDPHSATAQFFINVANNPFLDFRDATASGFGYAVFGKVTQGMEVMMRIAHTPTGPGGPFSTDVPRQPVVIQSIALITDK
jgi:peptidyl-prolyl cis-trans isomerase A (cyclophilin A)/peptidyl-prolyl cis-trans isomerase B (cyclophilin B)